jgi:hypothetical protein
MTAKHAAESDMLRRLARRTLAADRMLGDRSLLIDVPDEAQLREHVISQTPIQAASSTPRRLSCTRKLIRSARVAAGWLDRHRRLTSTWRGDEAIGRPLWLARAGPASGVVQLTRGGRLFVFSVPITDRRAATVERRVVALRAAGDRLIDPISSEVLEALERLAIASVRRRCRQLMARRRAVVRVASDRERAIAAELAGSVRRTERQGGLFDARAERAAAITAGHAGEVQRQLGREIDTLLLSVDIEIGRPRLVVIAGTRS